MERKFTLEYWKDDGWYVGRIKEVPGVFSQGSTLAELEENIADAYKMVLAEKDEYIPSVEIKEKDVSLQIWKETNLSKNLYEKAAIWSAAAVDMIFMPIQKMEE